MVITRSEGHTFKSTGRVVRQAGWKTVVSDPDKKKETETPLPELKTGDLRQVKSTKIKQETTKAPPPHTDASLLARMEHPGADLDDEELQEALKKNGLGTPATRAAIIERLVEVGYADRRGKAIRATEKGEKLIAVVPEDIASPVLTGKWEQALEEIARGSGDPDRFMEGIKRLAARLVSFAANKVKGVSFPPEVRGKSGKVRQVSTAKLLEGIVCPLCGKAVTENSKAFGCSAWKEGCRFTLWKNAFVRVKGPLLNDDIVRLLLTRGEAQGSSGVIRLGQGIMSFSPLGAQQPILSIPIRYEPREKPAAGSVGKASEKPRKAPARRPKS
jgi:DNA topoisomerase-3